MNTHSSIIESGFIAIANKEDSKITIQKICDIAGVGTGTFYEYFSNKDDLFIAMNNHFMTELLEVIDQFSPAIFNLNITDAVRHIFNEIIIFLDKEHQRYTTWVKVYPALQHLDKDVNIIKSLNRLAIEYALSHPETMQIKNLRVMLHIVINSYTAVFFNYLMNDNNSFSLDELCNALIDIMTAYLKCYGGDAFPSEPIASTLNQASS